MARLSGLARAESALKEIQGYQNAQNPSASQEKAKGVVGRRGIARAEAALSKLQANKSRLDITATGRVMTKAEAREEAAQDTERALANIQTQRQEALAKRGMVAASPKTPPTFRDSGLVHGAEAAYTPSRLNESTKANIDKNWSRWLELASAVRPLSDSEKQEAKSGMKALENAIREIRGWHGLGGSDEEKRLALSYDALSGMLQNRSSAGGTFGAGIISSVPFMERIIDEQTKRIGESGIAERLYEEDLASALNKNNGLEDARNTSPTAYAVGNVAGNVLQTVGVSKLAKAGTGLIKGYSKLAPWIQNAINSGLAFGTTGTLQALDDVQTKAQWDRREQQRAREAAANGQVYTPREYDGWQQVEDVLKQAGIRTLGGIGGSIAGSLVGNLGKGVLMRHNLQTPFAEAVRQTLVGTAFSGGNLASTYFLYPKEARPGKEQIVQDLAVAFLFSAATSTISTMQTTKANKAFLDNAVRKMQDDYGRTISGTMNNAEKAAALDKILAYNQNVRKAISQNYYAGQQKYIDDLLSSLNAIDDQINLIKTGVASGAGGATVNSGNSMQLATSLAASPGLISQTGTSSQQLAQAAASLGESGAKAFQAAYAGEADAAAYMRGFAAVYNAAGQGRGPESLKADPYVEALSPAQRLAAYHAGTNDAQAAVGKNNALPESGPARYNEQKDIQAERGVQDDRRRGQESETERGTGGELGRDQQVYHLPGETGILSETGGRSAGELAQEGRAGGSGEPGPVPDRGVSRLSPEARQRLAQTAIRDEAGEPLVVSHWTANMEFDRFEEGDLGFHFGSEEQGAQRAVNLGKEPAGGRLIRAYLDMRNPLRLDTDQYGWNAAQAAITLWNKDIISWEEYQQIYQAAQEDGGRYKSESAKALRQILADKGYDGIVYANAFEGEGPSYIAFYPEQVVIVDDGKGKAAAKPQTGTKTNEEREIAKETFSERWEAERIGGQAEAASQGAKTKKTLGLSELVRKIEHDFGINITAGHIRSRDTLGQYNTHSEGIRTKVINNLPTIAHELGHHLDYKYGLVKNAPKDVRKELLDNYPQEKRAAYKESKWPAESFAEFMRKFLQNRETAAIDYPLAAAYLREKMPSKEFSLLEDLADEVNTYYSLGAAEAPVRMRGEKQIDFRDGYEKLGDTSDRLYQAWVDSNYGIKRFSEAAGDKRIYQLASNSAYADAVAYAILTGDLTDANGQYVSDGLKKVLEEINTKDKKEYRDFGDYLICRHGPERLAEGMRVFADDRQNSTQWMRKRARELEEKYPQFRKSAEALYEFQQNFLITWGVRTGLVASENAKAWRERWQYYVPFNRDMGEKGRMGARRSFANQDSTIRRAKGSGRDIQHPVDNIINNMVRMVNAGIRNAVMTEITKAAENMQGSAVFLEKVPAPLVQQKMDTGKLKKQLFEAVALSPMSDEAVDIAFGLIENLDDILIQYARGKAFGDVVSVLKNGKQEFWKINDPLLLESITNMSPMRAGAVAEIFGRISRFMTGNITGNNVIWSLFSNMPRDLMTYFTYSKDKNPIHIFGGIASAYINKVKGIKASPLYKEYLAMGGGQTSAYTADINLSKKIRNKISKENRLRWLNPLEWVEFVSNTIELGPRFSYYKILREKGFSPQEAFYGSSDITVNFRRGGRISREANKYVPFLNANIQGLDKFARWVRADEAPPGQKGKAAAKRAMAYIAASAILAAIMVAANGKDEESQENYKQLSNYTKNSFFCIPLGDGKFFAIPKLREIAVLSSLMETFVERYVFDNEQAFAGFYEYATNAFLPSPLSDAAQLSASGAIGSLGILGVGAYLVANKDFLGKPIVSAGLENLEPKDQYTARTSKIAKWVGQGLNWSPQKIDYFFQSTLGGWWKLQRALFPVDEKERDKSLGIRNSYIKDNQYSTDLVNRLYDTRDAAEKKKNSNPEDMEAALLYRLGNTMTTFYSRYNSLSKTEAETEKNRATRQLALDMTAEFNKYADSRKPTAEQAALYSLCKRLGDVSLLPQAMATIVKDDGGKEHKLTSSQYVNFQTEYLTLYWDYVGGVLQSPSLKTAKEKQTALEAAKIKANEDAKAKMLKRLGVPNETYEKNAMMEAVGLTPSEYALYKAALEKYDENNNGRIDQDEARNAVESIPGLSEEEQAFLWQSTNKGWKGTSNPYSRKVGMQLYELLHEED